MFGGDEFRNKGPVSGHTPFNVSWNVKFRREVVIWPAKHPVELNPTRIVSLRADHFRFELAIKGIKHESVGIPQL